MSAEPPLPPGWACVPVREVGEVRLGRQRSPQFESGRHTTPYLRVANVHDGHIDFSDVLSMDFTEAERQVYSVEPGDIFLNEGQSIELVGRCAIYRGPPGRYCFQNSLVRFRCGPRAVPAYCRAVFKHWLDHGRFMQVAKQTTSIAHLGADRFAAMHMPLPPRAEQERIASVLDALDDAVAQAEATVAKKLALRNGLLDDLLGGRVRVPLSESPRPSRPGVE